MFTSFQMINSNPQKINDQTFEDLVFQPNGQVRPDCPFLSLSRYSVILRRWLRFFNLTQILIIDGDEFKEDQINSLARAEEFIGARSYITQDKFALNEQRGVYCIKTGPGENDLQCLAGGKGRPHPDIAEDKLIALQEYFRPFNEDFFRVVGKRYNW